MAQLQSFRGKQPHPNQTQIKPKPKSKPNQTQKPNTKPNPTKPKPKSKPATARFTPQQAANSSVTANVNATLFGHYPKVLACTISRKAYLN
jgi:hypothetical protein